MGRRQLGPRSHYQSRNARARRDTGEHAQCWRRPNAEASLLNDGLQSPLRAGWQQL